MSDKVKEKVVGTKAVSGSVTMEITDVTLCTGDARILFLRGKKRAGFELDINMKWTGLLLLLLHHYHHIIVTCFYHRSVGPSQQQTDTLSQARLTACLCTVRPKSRSFLRTLWMIFMFA